MNREEILKAWGESVKNPKHDCGVDYGCPCDTYLYHEVDRRIRQDILQNLPVNHRRAAVMSWLHSPHVRRVNRIYIPAELSRSGKDVVLVYRLQRSIEEDEDGTQND